MCPDILTDLEEQARTRNRRSRRSFVASGQKDGFQHRHPSVENTTFCRADETKLVRNHTRNRRPAKSLCSNPNLVNVPPLRRSKCPKGNRITGRSERMGLLMKQCMWLRFAVAGGFVAVSCASSASAQTIVGLAKLEVVSSDATTLTMHYLS